MKDIHYVDVGEGDVALFVHGVGTSSHLWRNVIAELRDERRCVAIDLPLHGGSASRADLSLPAMAEAVAELCDGLGLDQVDLVGNDTGGAIAQIFAVTHPERLRSLTLTNCDVHTNLPPEDFKPTVELAARGELAPMIAALMGEPELLAASAYGQGYAHIEDPVDAGRRLPAAHPRQAGRRPRLRTPADLARRQGPDRHRGAAHGAARAGPGGVGHRRRVLRPELGALAAGHAPGRQGDRRDRGRAAVLPRRAGRRAGPSSAPLLEPALSHPVRPAWFS